MAREDILVSLSYIQLNPSVMSTKEYKPELNNILNDSFTKINKF